MTTLNARASEAWNLVEAESEFGFESDQDAFEEGWETGYKARDAESAPRPVIDREAVKAVLDRRLHGEQVVDLIVELARPMPTREEIDQAVQETFAQFEFKGQNDDWGRLAIATRNAVLALLNGSES